MKEFADHIAFLVAMEPLYFPLVINAAILIVLATFHYSLASLRLRHPRLHGLFSGFFFGGIGITCMLFPLYFSPEVFVDLRGVIIGMGALCCGPLTALLSAGMAVGYRLWIGGSGTLGGVVTIIGCMFLGLLFRNLFRKDLLKFNPLWFIFFGFLIACVKFGSFLLIPPWPTGLVILRYLWTPMMFIVPIATLLLGLLIRMEEHRMHTQRELRQSEINMRVLTESISNGILVVDTFGNLVFYNPAAVHLIGPPLEPVVKILFKSFSLESSKELEIRGKIFEVHASETLWNDRKCYVFTIMDITERKRAAQIFLSLVEEAPSAIYILKGKKFYYVNRMMEKLTGFSREELIGREAQLLVHPEDREFVRNEIVRMLKGTRKTPIEFRAFNRNGEIRWANLLAKPALLEGEKVVFVNFLDITEKKKLEIALNESHEKLKRVNEIIYQLALVDTEKDLLEQTSKALCSTFELKSCELLSEENPRFSIEPAPSGDIHIYMPVPRVGIFQLISSKPLSEENLRLTELLANYASLMIQRIRLKGELERLALHDSLTGLYNRHYLFSLLEQEEKRARRYSRRIGFLMVDVNGLKSINDEKGHLVGDRVLKEVARLLRDSVRESDVIVRYGGDEFLVVLFELNDDGVKKAIDRIKKKVEEYNACSPEIPISLSIGGSYWDPGEGKSLDEALSEADRNMYKEKLVFRKHIKN